jgi:hypothetical protein
MVTVMALATAVTGGVLSSIVVSALRQLGLIDWAGETSAKLLLRLKKVYYDGLIDLRGLNGKLTTDEASDTEVKEQVQIADPNSFGVTTATAVDEPVIKPGASKELQSSD